MSGEFTLEDQPRRPVMTIIDNEMPWCAVTVAVRMAATDGYKEVTGLDLARVISQALNLQGRIAPEFEIRQSFQDLAPFHSLKNPKTPACDRFIEQLALRTFKTDSACRWLKNAHI